MMRIFTNDNYSTDELSLIKKEHRKAYLELFKSTLFVQILFPVFLSFVFYSLISNVLLFGWLFAISLVTLLRCLLTFYWYKIDFCHKKNNIFEIFSLLLSLLAGFLWGITVVIMDFNHYPEQSVFLNIIVFGLTAGSVGIGSYWFEYFIIYNFSVFSIYIAFYLIGIPEPYYLLALSLMLFGFFMTQIVLAFHRGNAQNIWLIRRNEKLAENLSDKKNQAEELAESRTRVLASASHDLRQPMQALNFFLSTLQPQLATDKSRDIFLKLESCTDSINELLNSMLDISKLDAKTLRFSKESIFIDNILEGLVQQFKNQADKKGLDFSFQHTGEYVCADPVLLQRILSNLISNAINYTDNGEVKISTATTADGLSVSISDTGPGLDSGEQKKVFEEFYQLDNPERDKKKGIGLGLSIVKKLCLLMDIPLSLKSEKNRGSCFGLLLPISQAPIQFAQPVKYSSYPELDAKKIIVIDDEDSIRQGLSELLHLWGCEVIAVDSENQAGEFLTTNSFRPDLVIADYRLRNNKTGVQAVNYIKTLLNNSCLPVIIISGDTEPARLEEVASSGYELIHKPVKPVELRRIMQIKLSAM